MKTPSTAENFSIYRIGVPAHKPIAVRGAIGVRFGGPQALEEAAVKSPAISEQVPVSWA